MVSLSKGLATVLILTIVISGIRPFLVKTVNAQTATEPSVPRFMLMPGDIVVITIWNQPIIPGESTANIFFNIRIKDHQSDNWVNVTVPNPAQNVRGYIMELGFGPTDYNIVYEDSKVIRALLALPNNTSSQIDFQVEAINGYLNTTLSSATGYDPDNTPVIIVNTSGWSPTQTVTIPASSVSPNPTATITPTPSIPELSWLVVVPLLFWVFSVAVIVGHRRAAIKN